ncbi:hypothetical protein Ciccas_006157 [Cichlidogyrus casuarinus]|uniref:Uncharacterized protein n=1 Tax=Cichlidogyrus casuarinus TaxID=1844966 RepID=A0ABD2Q6L7_9PLAT
MAQQQPKCVFCGLDYDAKYGQGELLRFKTNLNPQPLPAWYSEYKNLKSIGGTTSSPRSTRRTPDTVAAFPNFILSTNDFNIGPHTCLDTFNAIKNNRIITTNGKPGYNGMPNPFFDLEGRPFGLADDLAKVGWPKPPDSNHSKLELENLVIRATPREGGEGGWIYAHHCCLSWSDGVRMNSSAEFEGVEDVMTKALKTVCSFCSKFGAQITCRYDGCAHSFHFPCATAAGCLQELEQLVLLCPKHITEAEVCSIKVQPCPMCDSADYISDMIFCTGCGLHFHNNCLEPPPILNPTVRVGWQCPDCKACLICRESKDEEKMLVCDVCDKGFHTYCLKPPLTTLPKNGFKCEHCRVCLDCGLTAAIANSAPVLEPSNSASNNPLASSSIKWHNNYTLCDRCSNARRRQNSSCPVCDRAWRCSLPASNPGQVCVWPGRRCTKCKRMVHSECDPMQAQLAPNCEDYSCVCCRRKAEPTTPSDGASQKTSTSPVQSYTVGGSSCGGDMDNVSVPGDENSNLTIPSGPSELHGPDLTAQLTLSIKQSPSIQAGGDPSPAVASPMGKNPRSKAGSSSSRSKSNIKPSDGDGTGASRKRSCGTESGSLGPSAPKQSNHNNKSGAIQSKTAGMNINLKRSMSNNSVNSSTSLARNRRNKSRKNNLASTAADSQHSSAKGEERDDHPTTIVLCRSSDQFVLGQDMCVACGSFGLDDNFLLACAQCGQCYHPFCADVPRVTNTMLERGWRCLDCTACEGCGCTSDENLLLLCDDCDISYHTFCLDPPLTQVPKGGWKCSHCVVCLCCGRRDPGPGCKWQSNYTLCGPCASMGVCPVCTLNYRDAELLVKCALCNQWLHAACDQIKTEEELDLVTDLGYNCCLCRDRGAKLGPGQIMLMNKHEANGSMDLMSSWKQEMESDDMFPDKMVDMLSKRFDEPVCFNLDTTKLFYMDGIVLTQYGVKTVRQQTLKQPPKKPVTATQQAGSPASATKKPLTSGSQTPQPEDESSQLSLASETQDPIQRPLHNSLVPPPTPLITTVSESGHKSPSSVATHSDDDTQSGSHKSAALPASKQNGKPKPKRTMNVGLGGFRAKPAKAAINKRQQLAAAGSGSAGQVIPGAQASAIVMPGGTVSTKRRQNSKRKSELEEHYPDYLMQAFLGDNLGTKSARTVSGSSVSDSGEAPLPSPISPGSTLNLKTMTSVGVSTVGTRLIGNLERIVSFACLSAIE